jgi:hypothetical protein
LRISFVRHDREVPSYRATIAYPYASAEGATAVLRGALRRMVPADQTPDWSTFDVTGPEERVDVRGNVWFEYRGTVACP